MGNFKKLSLVICFFLIVNQDIIGNKHFDKRQLIVENNLEGSIKTLYLFSPGSVDTPKFPRLPHTSIYLK